MNAKTRTLIHLVPLLLAATAEAQVGPADLINSVTQSDTGYQIAERGQDFAVVRKVTTTTDAAGTTAFGTNEFTLLENGLHYFGDEQWKVSEDIIEAFPGGAIASRGPYKTIFSPDLNAEAVFDIQTPEGQRIRGGVRAIQLTDRATGKEPAPRHC